MARKYNAHAVTGNANGVTPTFAISGNPVHIGKTTQKVADLSAVLTVTAATSTLTFTPRWQVSNDGSTYINAASAPQNPATIAIATGTSASTSVAVPAPASVLSYQYARCQLIVGVVTGTSSDLYSIGYTYRVPGGYARKH